MEELRDRSEQTRHPEPGSDGDRHSSQSLQDYQQAIIDHHRCLMDHEQFVLNHHRTVLALYQAALSSQRTGQEHQAHLDWQIYCRALRNHDRLVENHRQMVEDYNRIAAERPRRREPV